MAIAKTTITKNAGYARSDIIDQLEQAFTWLGWQGEPVSGIVTGIISYTGGGDINTFAEYDEVFPISTSGIGTGASFYVYRPSGGTVTNIAVNRPGYGYTNGESLVLSSEDIGGSLNGASNLNIVVSIAGNESPISYGGTTQFFDKDLSGRFPWGVVKHTIQPNKKYGTTYRAFQVSGSLSLNMTSSNDFHPWNGESFSFGNYYPNRFAGRPSYDVPRFYNLPSSSVYSFNTSSQSSIFAGEELGNTISSSISYQLDLNVYRSGLDPNFAIFSYKQPTLSSTHLTSNSYLTWFHHNYTTNLWDLDELYLGAITEIIPEPGNTTAPQITFRTHTGLPAYDNGTSYEARRESWSGFGRVNQNPRYIDTVYQSRAYPQTLTYYNSRPYYRSSTRESYTDTNFNAVIKGLPVSAEVLPVPYYIPDDFVLIDFDYNVALANIQQGDTVTISGSEVYTVITGSYNQTSVTRGILFCARVI